MLSRLLIGLLLEEGSLWHASDAHQDPPPSSWEKTPADRLERGMPLICSKSALVKRPFKSVKRIAAVRGGCLHTARNCMLADDGSSVPKPPRFATARATRLFFLLFGVETRIPKRRRVQGEAHCRHKARSASPLRADRDAPPPGTSSRGLRRGGRLAGAYLETALKPNAGSKINFKTLREL